MILLIKFISKTYFKTQGYISYMKGNNPLIFPKILYPKNSIIIL